MSCAANAEPIELVSRAGTVRVDPATLAVAATPADGGTIELSAAMPAGNGVADLRVDPSAASWRWPDRGIDVTLRLDGPRLHVRFRVDRPGDLTWPILPAASDRRGFVVPVFNGLYVAADDRVLGAFLADEPISAVNGLSMPFWGVDLGPRTLTYALDDAFHTDLAFQSTDGRLGVAATHRFVDLDKTKTYGVTIEFTDAGPAAPALAYRRLLIERGEFVSLKQKIERTPDVAKLIGAAHVYVWGHGPLAREDVRDFKRLATALVEAKSDVAQSIWQSLDEPTRTVVTAIPTQAFVDRYQQGVLIDAINAHLRSAGPLQWPGIAAAFPDVVRPPDEWGDGVSTKMIDALVAAKLDRLWLGSPDWESLSAHPAAVRRAIDAGYLIGPYDSYHSIHAPDQQPTWESAQFTQDLFDRGGITRADGTTRKGFQQRGKLLSPTLARPAVEERVNRLMASFRCNSWFVDCDATGEVFDDFATRTTQIDDAAERLSRMNWIAASHRAVVGSEGGHAYAAPAIAYAHGIVTPGFGWGDAAVHKDKASPFYLGAYFPPDAPAVFFKRVPMKPQYAAIYADPRTRLPLYQLVFHDSVIATHWWGSGSLKFEDPKGTRQLLELLYDAPPLYHLNLAEWSKRKAEIGRHYAFWSPIHREAALLPMTDFRWLGADRLVQRTTFGDGAIVLTANFGDAAAEDVPPRTIVARWRDGRTASLTCGD